MTYEPLPINTVSLSELELDLDNYRIPTRRDDQAGALAYLFASENVLEAAKMILRDGYFDNEVPIVTREDGKYVVLEGNRRVSALKALQNPLLVPEHAEQVRALLKRYGLEAENLPTEIRVIVAPDRDTAAPHIARLHTGLSKKPWSRDQQATYYYSLLNTTTTLEDVRARYPGVGLARFIRMAVVRRFLTGVHFRDQSLHDYVTGNALKMSSFEFAYRRPEIAQRVGITFETDGLLRPADRAPDKVGRDIPDEHRAALELLITEFRAGNLNTRSSEFESLSTSRAALLRRMDVASGRADGTDESEPEGNVTDSPAQSDAAAGNALRSEQGQKASDSNPAYAVEGTSGSDDRKSAATGESRQDPQSDTEDDAEDVSPENAASTPRGPNHPDTRDTLSLTAINYGEFAPVTLQRRYIELRGINTRKFPLAAAMLMRSVVETTIKFHFEGTPTPATGELRPSAEILANAYGQEKPIKAQIARLKSGGETIPGSIQWFNLVAHGVDSVVEKKAVHEAWTLVQPILRRLLRPAQNEES